MRRMILFSAFVLFISCSENGTTKEFLSFELRLAASQSSPDYVEMTLYNSDLKFYVEDSVFLRNSDMKSANVIDVNTHPKVLVTLTQEGTEKFADFTERNIGRNAAILVGGKLVSAPRINAKIEEGTLIIVGYFSPEEAEKIARGILIDRK